MKKLLLLITLLFSLSSFANDIRTLAEYTNRFGEEYWLSLYYDDYGQPKSVFIPCFENREEIGFLDIELKNIAKFRDYLIRLRDKYVEWTKLAIENNIENKTKDMPIKCPMLSFVWGDAETYFGDSEFTAKWSYSEDADILLLGAKVHDERNSLISRNFFMAFACVDDFNKMIEAISQKNIDKCINGDDNDDIFK